MRVVIDTNVFVSSFFGGHPGEIIKLWRDQKLILCLSKDILKEYVDVLRRIGLGREEELEELILLFRRGHNLVFSAKTLRIRAVKGDPADDKFIECAVKLKAEAVITGDAAMLALREYQGIRIFNPKEFLQTFANSLDSAS